MPASRLKVEICRILKDEGYIKNFRHGRGRAERTLRVFLRYSPDGEPAITRLQRVASPGAGSTAAPSRSGRCSNGMGIGIISTSQGLLTDRQARERAWAARSSARSGREDRHVAHRKKADPDPQGGQGRGRRRRCPGRGPEGQGGAAGLPGIAVEVDDGELNVARRRQPVPQRAKHGLARALLANAVQGVAEGFTKTLDIVGVGYRPRSRAARSASRSATRTRWCSRSRRDQGRDRRQGQRITVTGADRQKVGQVAAEIRGLRKPDPYKGKGIKYTDESHQAQGRQGRR